MFPKAAAGSRNTMGMPGHGRGVRFGRWKSRVRGLPEIFDELPASCLAEEIDTPGQGQVKALITLAGNPALSTPNSDRLRRGLSTLQFMVSIDIYLNETTRYANVILPPPPVLARSHYDLALYQIAIHNVAHYSPPVMEREPGALDEWELFLRLAGILAGQQSNADSYALDDLVVTTLIQREVATAGSNIENRDVEELLDALKPRIGPERMLDFLLRSGPYGDAFGRQDGISLATLEAHPHGVDLGPLQPRIPEVLRTPFEQNLTMENGHMLLIGRRDLRSNNSWMHNLHVLTKGKERCTLHIHPDDASNLEFVDGSVASVASRTGSLEIPIEITDAIMPGVVSIPHGWGHTVSGTKTHIASEHPAVNTNVLTDEVEVDPLSGNAVLNGIPVVVEKMVNQ